MGRLALLLLLTALAAPAQFLEFRIRFDDGGCLSCAESLEGRLRRVRGVETVTLDVEHGVVEVKLAEDNGVRLAPLMSRIEQGAAKALETSLKAKGVLVERPGGGWSLHLQSQADGQVYALEGDSNGRSGPVLVEATVIDAENGRLHVVSLSPVE